MKVSVSEGCAHEWGSKRAADEMNGLVESRFYKVYSWCDRIRVN
jgi:hypothetical protein